MVSAPHGGRYYPAGLFNGIRQQAARSLEDMGTDIIVSPLASWSRAILLAMTGRAVCDLNRPETALDPLLCPHAPSLPDSSAYKHYIAAGYGVIARLSAQRKPLYERVFSIDDTKDVLKSWHRPYHERLAGQLGRMLTCHDHCLLVDIHSMPDASLTNGAHGQTNGKRILPDFIFGNLYGATLASKFVQQIDHLMNDTGYSWRWNNPYAGGFTTQYYGLEYVCPPKKHLSVLQIEVNRSLFTHRDGRLYLAILYQISVLIDQLLCWFESELKSGTR